MIRGSEDGTGSRRPLLGDAGIVTPPDSQRKGRCRNAAVFFCVEKVRLSFVQPLSLASLDSSPSRGASGEEEKFSALPKPPLGRGGGSASALTERLSPAEAHGQALLRTTSQSRFARQGRVAAPSVCFAAARILLAAAPTAPPCFRHWRRSSPLPLVGEPLAKPFTLRGLPKPPLGRGGGIAKQ